MIKGMTKAQDKQRRDINNKIDNSLDRLTADEINFIVQFVKVGPGPYYVIDQYYNNNSGFFLMNLVSFGTLWNGLRQGLDRWGFSYNEKTRPKTLFRG